MTIRILLVRHGESEGNVDGSAYIKHGDSKVALTDQGWRQAAHTGAFLKNLYQETDTNGPPILFVSSYKRTKETLSGIALGLGDHFRGKHRLKPKEDPRLVERFFGAVNHLYHPEGIMDEKLAGQLSALSTRVYAKDPFVARPLFGDSPKDMLESVKGFIETTMKTDIKQGERDFLFVVHGAVIQAFLMSWAHLPMDAKGKLANPGNGDVIQIEGDFGKDWNIKRIYDGQKMEAVDEPILEGIKLFDYDDLPHPPAWLEEEFSPNKKELKSSFSHE